MTTETAFDSTDLPRHLQIHILKYAQPGNANRDDLGNPKNAIVGQSKRLRWSSQSQKRALRVSDTFKQAVQRSENGKRTRQIGEFLVDYLLDRGFDLSIAYASSTLVTHFCEKGGSLKNSDLVDLVDGINAQAEMVSELVNNHDYSISEIKSIGSSDNRDFESLYEEETGEEAPDGEEIPDNPLQTGHLLFLHDDEFQNAKEQAVRIAEEIEYGGTLSKSGVKDHGSDIVEEIFDTDLPSPDVGLFGRMMTSNPGQQIDGSVSMAHAFSTNSARREDDYFTAVDDLSKQAVDEGKEGSDSGSGYMGTKRFMQGVMYQWAAVDVRQLFENLGGDEKAVRQVLIALTDAFRKQGPTGQHTSFGRLPPAQHTHIEAISGVPHMAAAAFIEEIKDDAILESSIDRLEDYLDGMEDLFPEMIEDEIIASQADYLPSHTKEDIDQFIMEM